MDCKLILLAVYALVMITASAEESQDIHDYKSYGAELAAALKKSISKDNEEDYDIVRRNPWLYQSLSRSSADVKETKKQTSNSPSKSSPNLELQSKLVITIEKLEKNDDSAQDDE